MPRGKKSEYKTSERLKAKIASLPSLPTDIDWARLAAFIDGEGCISIKIKKGRGNKTAQHALYVNVINTDARLMRWLCATFTGITYPTRYSGSKSNWKLALRWEMYGEGASWILENCLPYMIMKREQAEIAIQMQGTMNHFRGPGYMIPFDLYCERDAMKEKLQALKRETHALEVL